MRWLRIWILAMPEITLVAGVTGLDLRGLDKHLRVTIEPVDGDNSKGRIRVRKWIWRQGAGMGNESAVPHEQGRRRRLCPIDRRPR